MSPAPSAADLLRSIGLDVDGPTRVAAVPGSGYRYEGVLRGAMAVAISMTAIESSSAPKLDELPKTTNWKSSGFIGCWHLRKAIT